MSNASEVVQFLLKNDVLMKGSFIAKSGLKLSFFLNFSKIHTGDEFFTLIKHYAQCIIDSEVEFDVVFGSAYKGIPLCVGVVQYLATLGINKSFCFDRKEAKDHGDKGNFVGSELQGKKVIFIDDVLTKGTSLLQAKLLLEQQGADFMAAFLGVDRQEVLESGEIVSTFLKQQHDLSIYSLATRSDFSL